MKTYESLGRQIGKLVDSKNKAYGNSFIESEKILKTLYPKGIKPEQYTDMLGLIRIIDKMFRIATKNKNYKGESAWDDISGYGLLGAQKDRNETNTCTRRRSK